MTKRYTPWHEHVEKAHIRALTEQFVNDVLAKGIVLTDLKVTWLDDGDFNVTTLGRPIKSTDSKSIH